MPIVGINSLLLALDETYRSAGVANYNAQLLRHLPAAAPDLHLRAFVGDRRFSAAPGMAVARPAWSTRRPLARIAWEQSALALASRRLDLLHGAVYASPLLASCPTVITVHDLTFVHHAAALKRFHRVYLRLITRLSAQRAVRVIAASENTRRQLIDWLALPPARVIAVPNGVSEEFAPATPVAVEAFRRQHGLPARFILFVGTLEPRKNVERLLTAFAQARAHLDADTCLVIAGSKGWYYQQIFAQAAALGRGDRPSRVIFPGFVPAAQLPWWYRAATVFVYPSLYEGFGLPVLEAMASGTAVITSNTSSLPEVTGDAAILIDPTDVDALAAALVRLLNDADLRAHLSAAGVRQAAQFSWRRCAEETVAVYREALGLPPGMERSP